MRDCEDVEMRELLPGYALGRLAPADRAAVTAHLGDCEVCREELALLSLARDVMDRAPAPTIDTAAITRALPRPQGRRRGGLGVFGVPAWRIAAALTLLTLGGLSVRGARRSLDPVPVTDTTTVPAVIAAAPPESLPAADSPAVAPSPNASAQVLMTGGAEVSSLADEDLEALIGALDRLEAAPHAEPEANPASRMVRMGTGDS